MKLKTSVTQPSMTEPPDGDPTRISRLFARFLGLLALYVQAERELEAVESVDPAVSAWPRDAEDRRREVTGTIAAIWTAAVARPVDRPLQRMAKLAGMMIEAETTEAFLTAYTLLDRYSDLFTVAGTDPAALKVRRMLDEAKDRLDDLATLSEHIDPVEVATILAEDAADRVARAAAPATDPSADPWM